MKEVEKACIKKLNVLATTVSATNRISIPGRRARESYVKVEKVKSHVRLLSMGGSVRVSRQEVKEKCAWNNPDPPPYLGENFASVFSKTNPFASNPYAELQQTLTLTQTKPDPPSLYFQTPVWNITSGKLHMDQTAPSAPTPATEGKVVPEHVRIMAAPCERANKQLKDEFEEILRTSKTYPDLRLALSEFKTELLRRGNASRSVRDELRQRVLQAEQEAEEHFKTSLKHHEVSFDNEQHSTLQKQVAALQEQLCRLSSRVEPPVSALPLPSLPPRPPAAEPPVSALPLPSLPPRPPTPPPCQPTSEGPVTRSRAAVQAPLMDTVDPNSGRRVAVYRPFPAADLNAMLQTLPPISSGGRNWFASVQRQAMGHDLCGGDMQMILTKVCPLSILPQVLEETGVGRMAKDEPLDHENLDRIDGIPKTVVTAMENIPDLAEMTDDRWCSCLRHFLRRHAKEKDTKVDRSPSSH
ncbi:uncharacterized protein [Antennarius striatus]|uniref:uncharacterized protein isoform X1 n=1 Tax=Antennarius striatus TaxID=241820 RepID=UPI0035B12F92